MPDQPIRPTMSASSTASEVLDAATSATSDYAPVAAREVAERLPQHAELKRRAVSGAVYTMVGFGAAQVMRLGSNLLLAWLLFPEAFGLMAIVKTVLQGLQMSTDLGIKQATIQAKHGDTRAFLDTAWTAQVVRGVVLWLCCVALALPVARFYGEPQLALMLPAAAVVVLLAGFSSTRLFSLERHLKIGTLTFVNFAGAAFSTAVVVACAYAYRSVWALIAGYLAGSVFQLVASYALAGFRFHRFGWDREARATLLTFGKWITVSTAITFLALQLDRLVLGKLVPLATLGVYNMALMLAMIPQQVSQNLSQSVLFPLLVARNRLGAPLADDLLRVRRAILPVGIAALAALAGLAPWFFGTLYDDRYADAAW